LAAVVGESVRLNSLLFAELAFLAALHASERRGDVGRLDLGVRVPFASGVRTDGARS
jgi:hypothetical protein